MSMAYYFDAEAPGVPVFQPCTFVPSQTIPGRLITVRESDGAAMVVEPNGTQVRWIPPGDPAFDSPWTLGTPMGDLLMYRSASSPTDLGVPHGYRMVTPS
jgi:hypothetical protein